jgi:hypothetical protein
MAGILRPAHRYISDMAGYQDYGRSKTALEIVGDNRFSIF